MTATGFLETLISLSLQIALLIGATAWVSGRRPAGPGADRLWSGCHQLILILTLVSFTLPHPRLWPHSFLRDQLDFDRVLTIESRVGLVLQGVWCSGIVIGLLRLLLSGLQAMQLLKASSPLDRTELERRCPSVFEQTGVSRAAVSLQIDWRTTSIDSGPFCWQFHHPRVVIPEFVLGFADEELQAVLLHETAHVAAGHPSALFTQRLVEIVFWFHPLVWWSCERATLNRELTCDRQAARNVDEAAACLRSLLQIAERGCRGPAAAPAGLPFGGAARMTRTRAAWLATCDDRPPDRPLPRVCRAMLIVAAVLMPMIHVPLDVNASDRSAWSPWPRWSATALHSLGIQARDYEIDAHRFHPHHVRTSPPRR